MLRGSIIFLNFELIHWILTSFNKKFDSILRWLKKMSQLPKWDTSCELRITKNLKSCPPLVTLVIWVNLSQWNLRLGLESESLIGCVILLIKRIFWTDSSQSNLPNNSNLLNPSHDADPSLIISCSISGLLQRTSSGFQCKQI